MIENGCPTEKPYNVTWLKLKSCLFKSEPWEIFKVREIDELDEFFEPCKEYEESLQESVDIVLAPGGPTSY
jgi:hypothetical protein